MKWMILALIFDLIGGAFIFFAAKMIHPILAIALVGVACFAIGWNCREAGKRGDQ